MSNEATILRIRAQVENLEGLNRARSAVRNFATESKAASNDLNKLRSLFKELGSESVRSVNNLKNYRTGLDALRQSAEIGSTTFKELTSEIKQLDTELGSLQGKQTQVAQGFNKITTATNSAIAAQRTYSGLIRNPLTGGYSMPPVQVPMGGRLLPAAQGFDFAAQDSRIQAQVAEASAQSARDARRRAKMQELANYSGTTIGARDPNTGALIAGGYGQFAPLPSQPAPSRFGLTQRSAAGAKFNLGQTAQGLGAVAAGGVFGGVEGAAGGLIGLGLGGPAGAVTGAAIGASVGMLRQALGATADYAAQLEKQRTALRQVVASQNDYNQSLQFITKTSNDLAIPQDVILKNFTRLSASVIGAGGSVKDAEQAFKGISAGILGTGGSLENLDAALLATAQVFSKGKVSAEELRGQIGERLPGAFTLFAESIGKTPQQLDKALSDGKVTLLDFQKFTENLFKKYGEAAEIIARSPENAGNRLKTTLASLSESVGTLLKPIGAAFQNTFADIFKIIDAAVRKLNEFLKIDEKGRRATLTARIATTEKQIQLGQSYLNIKPSTTGAAYVGLNRDQINKGIERQQAQLLALRAELAGLNVKPRPATSGLAANVGDTVGGTEKSNKAAENAAQRLREKIKQQLADADKLFSLETARLDITLAATKQEELEAKYNKVIVERREKYLSLQKNAVSEQERMRIAEAQSVAITADHQAYLGEINKLMQDQTKELYAQVGLSATLNKNLQAALAGAFTGGTATGTFRTDVDLMPGLTGGKLGSRIEELRKELETLNDPISQIIVGAESIGAAFTESFTGMINGSMSAQESLANFFKNIANYFLDMAGRMIAKYIEMQIIGLAQQFLPAVGGIFGPKGAPNFSGASLNMSGLTEAAFESPPLIGSANGNVFAQNGIVPFANGGIVDRPMMFPFAKGIGLMGEAGPEAIMPLKRGADGKLGVAGGGGGTSVTVNVDASGSSVQGNNGQSAALGRAIAASVQAELVKQKRPGGLLA
jgi:tape measure domain-containing protein